MTLFFDQGLDFAVLSLLQLVHTLLFPVEAGGLCGGRANEPHDRLYAYPTGGQFATNCEGIRIEGTDSALAKRGSWCSGEVLWNMVVSYFCKSIFLVCVCVCFRRVPRLDSP